MGSMATPSMCALGRLALHLGDDLLIGGAHGNGIGDIQRTPPESDLW